MSREHEKGGFKLHSHAQSRMGQSSSTAALALHWTFPLVFALMATTAQEDKFDLSAHFSTTSNANGTRIKKSCSNKKRPSTHL